MHDREGSLFFDKLSPTVHQENVHDRYWARLLQDYVTRMPPNSTVLDVGCGSGMHHVGLKRSRPDVHLVGIDTSIVSIRTAKDAFKGVANSADYVVSSIDAIPFRPRTFDAFLILFVLHHVLDLACLNQIRYTLRRPSRGLIIEKLGKNPLHQLASRVFPLLPSGLRNRYSEEGEHIDSFGQLPPIFYRYAREYVDSITSAFRPSSMEVDESGFGYFFWITWLPGGGKVIPARFVLSLYALERKLSGTYLSRKFPLVATFSLRMDTGES